MICEHPVQKVLVLPSLCWWWVTALHSQWKVVQKVLVLPSLCWWWVTALHWQRKVARRQISCLITDGRGGSIGSQDFKLYSELRQRYDRLIVCWQRSEDAALVGHETVWGLVFSKKHARIGARVWLWVVALRISSSRVWHGDVLCFHVSGRGYMYEAQSER